MPISDPEKLRIAIEHRFNYWICRECGARNRRALRSVGDARART